MARQFLGKEVTAALDLRLQAQAAQLQHQGVAPKLAIVRCGAAPSDLAYEKGAMARAQRIGVAVERLLLPESAQPGQLLEAIDRVNADPTIHGCLLLRPLPAHLRGWQDEICNRLSPDKDVDGMTDLSSAGVFAGKPLGFPPCTPQACMEILRHYGVDCTGKRAVVIGRSLVVGKPLAMLLLAANATVTVCHTKSVDLPQITRQADLIITAAGALGSLTADHVRPGQIVLDVSVNWDPGKPNAKGGLGGLAGDAVFQAVEPIVDAITPVPGGVGSVTTSVLIGHVVEAARRTLTGEEAP